MRKTIVLGQGGLPIASLQSLLAHQAMHHESALNMDNLHQVPLYAPSMQSVNEDQPDDDISTTFSADDQVLSEI